MLHRCVNKEELQQSLSRIKALTALVGRLSLSLGWENGPEWELKTVLFNPQLPVIKTNSADPDQTPRSVANILDVSIQMLQPTLFTRHSDVKATRIVRL